MSPDLNKKLIKFKVKKLECKINISIFYCFKQLNFHKIQHLYNLNLNFIRFLIYWNMKLNITFIFTLSYVS